jgi:ADP-ribose pyrophosphatase
MSRFGNSTWDPLDRYFTFLKRNPELACNKDAAFRLVLDRSRIESFQHESGAQIGILAEDKYAAFVHDLVENEHGELFVYLRIIVKKHLSGSFGTVILPVERHVEGDIVILIRTYRHSLRAWSLELPRGFGEPQLSSPDNARKELLEETGLDATSLELLGTVEPDSGLFRNPAQIFLAEVNSHVIISSSERTEAVRDIVRLNLDELSHAVVHGSIKDSYSLAALTLARAKGVLA